MQITAETPLTSLGIDLVIEPITVYISGLPTRVHDEKIRKMISIFGEISKWTRFKDLHNKELYKNFAFCEFSSMRSAETCHIILNGRRIDNCRIKVNLDEKKKEKIRNFNMKKLKYWSKKKQQEEDSEKDLSNIKIRKCDIDSLKEIEEKNLVILKLRIQKMIDEIENEILAQKKITESESEAIKNTLIRMHNIEEEDELETSYEISDKKKRIESEIKKFKKEKEKELKRKYKTKEQTEEERMKLRLYERENTLNRRRRERRERYEMDDQENKRIWYNNLIYDEEKRRKKYEIQRNPKKRKRKDRTDAQIMKIRNIIKNEKQDYYNQCLQPIIFEPQTVQSVQFSASSSALQGKDRDVNRTHSNENTRKKRKIEMFQNNKNDHFEDLKESKKKLSFLNESDIEKVNEFKFRQFDNQ